MLELTKLDGSKLFLDPHSVESIEDQQVEFSDQEENKQSYTCTLITVSSGKEHLVLEQVTDIYIDFKHMMEEMNDNQLTLPIQFG